MIRNEDFKKYFTPRELSIGPIHAADPNLFKMELKLKLVAHFVERRKRSAKLLLGDVRTKIKDIKACFANEVIQSYEDEDLIWLLFLDGCSMLEFVQSYVDRRISVFGISNGQAALIQQDLFLLENQIPLLVLEVLMDSKINWPCKDNLQNDFFQFIFASNTSNFPRDLKDFKGPVRTPCRKPVHVLDLLRYVIVIHDMTSLDCSREIILICLMTLRCCGSRALYNRYGMNRLSEQNIPEYWSKKQSLRNIQELKTAGIKFKTTQCLKEVSFHSRFFSTGQLKLPTFVVDNSTPHMLLNLVTYEMCLPNNHANKYGYDPNRNINDSWVMSYVNLLDLLIDNEQDVKDLRAADVLRNCLSSDIEAANMINSIGSYCFAPPKDTYEHIKYKIERHYRRRFAIWMAQVCHSHFSSPWTILALLAATAVLALTVVQTYYTVNPKQ
ncbi:hypothetical protein TIFTF001_054956 [Ficus carica]|uniref:Uncharacterized protein n=1 Tax=Ficus carica TaxID=3494 RepID=A0AA88EFP7_FICCA|nr:hypothetical protein TIFTF001_054953 [Ficus carica]GMN74048.1 hypothetical protein TIFTF001_054954 [Ficus carica]GMN74049.1 hypothetical protein TIFTF001_054955 [Ficus carica]GMN74052.1 hypothetical protein TIFTF001_054956 [Ficus carica]